MRLSLRALASGGSYFALVWRDSVCQGDDSGDHYIKVLLQCSLPLIGPNRSSVCKRCCDAQRTPINQTISTAVSHGDA